MNKLDLNTFGDSPAAINVVKIINERNLSTHKLSKLLEKYNRNVNDLFNSDLKSKKYFYLLLTNDALKNCDLLIEPLNTYAKNIIKYKHRINLNKLI